MCDVKVMVETPDSLIYLLSPSHIQTPPSPTLSVFTDLDSCDLLMPIIGSQVHEQSETVQWCDRSTTILPCIMKDGINICQEDANAVSFFVSLPESLSKTSQNVIHLCYSDWCFKSQQLCDEISAALHISKAIVIQQVSTSEPVTLDLDYLEDRGISELMCHIPDSRPIL
jgi:hypothetical protein